MGARVAKSLVSTAFSDWIELSAEYSMVETVVPESWTEKSLLDLKLRERYGLNVVGIRKGDEVDVMFPATHIFSRGDVIIVIGPNAVLSKFSMKQSWNLLK
jgi:trk system potassium uptake protein TrkA